MKRTRFDGEIRSLDAAGSRRKVLTVLLGGLPGLFLTAWPDGTSAEGKKARRKRRQRKDRRSSDGPCSNSGKEGKDCRCQKQGDACTVDASCCPRTKGMSCQEGSCQPCDACLSGCQFDSVQKALDAATPGEVIHICAGVFGERLVIEKDVTLIGVGDGAKGTTLDGGGGGSTVTLRDVAVTLERLRITGGGGVSAGGGVSIEQAGSLTLTNCTVSGNAAVSEGGGIFKQNGSLTLNNSVVTDNEAGDRGGGIFHEAGATTLNASIVSGNEGGDSGGGIYFQSGAMTLFESVIENNRAGLEGGGIFREGGAFALLDNSTVTGNSPDDCVGIDCSNA